MTEREKLLNGEFYNSRDNELLTIHNKAKVLLNKFNGEVLEKPNKVLEQLLGCVGNGVWIEKPFFCDYGEHIFIGKNTFINFNCTFLDSNKITIGENVLIGPGTGIFTPSHPVNPIERINNNNGEAPYKTYALPITIGNNVWIGGNVSILAGVTIGDNCVIGAGSVVTKSIPSNSVAVGNPCRIIRDTRE
ncbi:sugar O-acetyltransferase [Clostridium lundense]|uniref:sugar O-acetyltransferase n=1 Tax=Clostridium lundense TaxID=319475 RepID=UPI0004801B60|nr:sugar O-acetyltransferase [Clostridium lundense]